MQERTKRIELRARGVAGASAEACDLYAQRKCAACVQNIQGLILYPLGEDEHEGARLALDSEIKGLWDQVR